MLTDVGEYIVGAYLRLKLNCDFVDYNVRVPGGGLQGLDELDVLGLNFRHKRAFLCEVTTHIRGVLYKNNHETVRRITNKYRKQQRYAQDHLPDFKDRHFMFWSPVVPRGYITREIHSSGSYKSLSTFAIKVLTLLDLKLLLPWLSQSILHIWPQLSK